VSSPPFSNRERALARERKHYKYRGSVGNNRQPYLSLPKDTQRWHQNVNGRHRSLHGVLRNAEQVDVDLGLHAVNVQVEVLEFSHGPCRPPKVKAYDLWLVS